MPGQRYETHHKICNLRYGTPGYRMNSCYKLEVIALLLLYLSQNTFYYKCYCYKGSYKGIVV